MTILFQLMRHHVVGSKRLPIYMYDTLGLQAYKDDYPAQSDFRYIMDGHIRDEYEVSS